MQRRAMRTPLGSAIRGSSILFDTNIYGNLKEKKEYVRWGINSENGFALFESDIEKIPKPKTKQKLTWSVTKIDQRECGQILTRVPGAYVKPPRPGIYESGTISDLSLDHQIQIKLLRFLI